MVAAFQTEPEDEVFAAVRADLDNWRTATAWAFGPLGDAELGQRLFLSAEWWLVETEARRWTDVALARVDAHTSNDIAVRLAYYEAKLGQRVSGNDIALVDNAARSIAYFDAIGDAFSAARASFARCAALLRLGRLADAEAELDASLERARGVGSLRLVGYALIDIARMRLEQGELDRANAACAEAIALFEKLRSLIGRSLSLQILAEIALRNGDPEAALNYGLEELACTRIRNEPHYLGVSLNNVAAFLIALDRFDEAFAYAREGLDLATRYALGSRQLWALHHLAAIEALRARDPKNVGPVLRAARLIGFVDARLAELQWTRDYFDRLEYERVLAVLNSLDVAQREAALAAGAAMTQAEAIEDALDLDDVAALPRV
jgi:tetratricopeptide (TPR) repeat protein